MSLSKKEIEHIAKLARLGLSEKEKEKHSKELSRILDYIDKLNEIKTESIKPSAQITGLTNVLRKDEKSDEIEPEKIKKIIGQAPERKDNFIKTKPILEK